MDSFPEKRLKLQLILEHLMHSKNVYFQPPEDSKMHYPCIVYDLATFEPNYADNRVHHRHTKWILTLIDPDSESPFLDVLADLPLCSHDRRYIADHLYHDMFTLYY